MKARTFVPGHISCVFRPVRGDSPETTGSLGFGIRLDKGCHACVSERDDGRIVITVNGEECDAPITRRAIGSMHPDKGLDIELVHDLPMEQGFGTSASGTFAAALCTAEILGRDRSDAVMATHEAECALGGGLGDLLATDCSYGVPVRTKAGPPGVGSTEDSGLAFRELTLIIFEEPLSTASVLGDPGMMERIIKEGDSALKGFSEDPSETSFFEQSNRFSSSAGLESERICEALDILRKGGNRAGMCMLGNSIFSDVPVNIAE